MHASSNALASGSLLQRAVCLLVALFGLVGGNVDALADESDVSDEVEAKVEADAQDVDEPVLRHPDHAFLIELRFIPQLAWISGTVQSTSTPQDQNIDLQDDVGLDDPEIDFGGSLLLRLGRHDISINAFQFESTSNTTLRKDLDFGGIVIPIERTIRAKTEYLNVDLQYGYSFFDLEKHGFRLGPTASIGYFRFKAVIEDVQSGRKGDIEEELPLPTIGVNFEIPYRRFLLRGDVSGLYINTSSFDGTGVRAGGSLAWRPFKHVGVVGGYRYIFADINDGRDDYEITLQGPYVGIELRY
jgi:hypothetical protein